MIWKLIYELEYWIQIGIAGDIVTSAESRPEYQHIVKELKASDTPEDKIPAQTLIALKKEAELPFWRQRTFWRLLWLKVRR